MPTHCPSIKGSSFPVWLDVDKKRLPFTGEGVKNDIEVCLPWHREQCRPEVVFTISVKNCSLYLVYKLRKIPECPYYYAGTN